MKKIRILCWVLFILSCHTSFAAKILLTGKNGEFPPGDVVGIEEQTIVVKTPYGNLVANFTDIDTILFDETADPTKPGIQFKNGDI